MDIRTNKMTVYICDDNREQLLTLRQMPEEDGIRVGKGIREIVYISAEDKYSVIYTRDGHYISDVSLTEYEMRLNRWGFFRIHRKYLL